MKESPTIYFIPFRGSHKTKESQADWKAVSRFQAATHTAPPTGCHTDKDKKPRPKEEVAT